MIRKFDTFATTTACLSTAASPELPSKPGGGGRANVIANHIETVLAEESLSEIVQVRDRRLSPNQSRYSASGVPYASPAVRSIPSVAHRDFPLLVRMTFCCGARLARQ